MDDGIRAGANSSTMQRSSSGNSGSGGIQLPVAAGAAGAAAAAAEDEPLAYNPFFSRLPGDFHERASAAGEEGGVDLCGPVVRRSML